MQRKYTRGIANYTVLANFLLAGKVSSEGPKQPLIAISRMEN